MLNEEQQAVLDTAVRALNENYHFPLAQKLRAVFASAAPADEGRETSAPTCNIAVDLTRELVRSAWVKRFNYVYDRMVEDSELMGFARAIQLECFKTIATAPTMSEAARDVLAERRRQIEQEGWALKHNDEHDGGQLPMAAASYAVAASYASAGLFPMPKGAPPTSWPWRKSWWKPTTPRRDLVKAGALILAELERIDRAAAKGGGDV